MTTIMKHEEFVKDVAKLLFLNSENSSYNIVDWEADTWESTTETCLFEREGVREQYYNKAIKICTFFDEEKDVQKVLSFLKVVNPRLTAKLIDEL